MAAKVAPSALALATRTDIDRRGAGFGDPPLATANATLRGQKTGTSTTVGPAEYYELSSDDGRPTAGTRPASMLEPWPQGTMERHDGIAYELVQALDAPVLQMVEQLPNVVQFFAAQLPVVAEPVIEVPKILPLDVPLRRLCPILRRSGLWSTTLTFQLLVVKGELLVFKVFFPDRVQQRCRNAFLS